MRNHILASVFISGMTTLAAEMDAFRQWQERNAERQDHVTDAGSKEKELVSHILIRQNPQLQTPIFLLLIYSLNLMVLLKRIIMMVVRMAQ